MGDSSAVPVAEAVGEDASSSASVGATAVGSAPWLSFVVKDASDPEVADGSAPEGPDASAAVVPVAAGWLLSLSGSGAGVIVIEAEAVVERSLELAEAVEASAAGLDGSTAVDDALTPVDDASVSESTALDSAVGLGISEEDADASIVVLPSGTDPSDPVADGVASGEASSTVDVSAGLAVPEPGILVCEPLAAVAVGPVPEAAPVSSSEGDSPVPDVGDGMEAVMPASAVPDATLVSVGVELDSASLAASVGSGPAALLPLDTGCAGELASSPAGVVVAPSAEESGAVPVASAERDRVSVSKVDGPSTNVNEI